MRKFFEKNETLIKEVIQNLTPKEMEKFFVELLDAGFDKSAEGYNAEYGGGPSYSDFAEEAEDTLRYLMEKED